MRWRAKLGSKRGGKGVRSRACPDVGATLHTTGGVSPAASVRRGTRWADSEEGTRTLQAAAGAGKRPARGAGRRGTTGLQGYEVVVPEVVVVEAASSSSSSSPV